LTAESNVEDRVRGALQLFESEVAGEGEAALRDIAREYVEYAPVHFFLGLIAQGRGDTASAIDFYAKALRADSKHVDATNNLAKALSDLSPEERVRVASDLGLRVSRTGSVQDAAAYVVEALYLKALEVDPSHRWALNNLGLHFHHHGNGRKSVATYSHALELYPLDAEINFNIAVALQAMGLAQAAEEHYSRAVSTNPQHVGAHLNLAALHHEFGDKSEAIHRYRAVLTLLGPEDLDLEIMTRNNLGTALYQEGYHSLAEAEHKAVLGLIRYARAGAGEGEGKVVESRVAVEQTAYVETIVGLLRVRKASCDWRDWEALLSHVKTQVEVHELQQGLPPSLLPFDSLLLPDPITPSWRLRLARAHSGRWAYGQGHSKCREAGVEHAQAGAGGEAGSSFESRVGGGGMRAAPGEGREWGGRPPRLGALEVGFIGCDFLEHPTAHMIEGPFLWQRRFLAQAMGMQARSGLSLDSQEQVGVGGPGKGEEGQRYMGLSASGGCCRYSVFSYGASSRGSTASRAPSPSRAHSSIRSLASGFTDLAGLGDAESVCAVASEGLHILVDLQGHTLGGNNEIAAGRPAPIQARVNYLVFPGTSGAPYMDYLLTDRHVTPPENARHFSEKLALLPQTYQANFYQPHFGGAFWEGGRDQAMCRRLHGLPPDPDVVFVNFNKVDKLDPESFSLWMGILRRVPSAVLWLLEPGLRQAVKARLRVEAEGHGVRGDRLLWAPRVGKSEHLWRHRAADLFLDTLTYGAHSTATDALRGGVPFLTMAGERESTLLLNTFTFVGDSFASRVGMSLVRNAGPGQNSLLVRGHKEYEDLAVRLASTERGRVALSELQRRLVGGDGRSTGGYSTEHATGGGLKAGEGGRGTGAGGAIPLFDTEALTADLNRVFMLMWEVHEASKVGEWGGGRTANIVL
ncbi:unnamed protein product, partial [Discosporangium mesarthrocarpum]